MNYFGNFKEIIFYVDFSKFIVNFDFFLVLFCFFLGEN